MSAGVERTPRGSIRTRWTLAIVLVGAVPLALLGLATLRFQKAGLEEAEKLHEVAIIDHVSDRIDTQLASVSGAAHRIGVLLSDARFGAAGLGDVQEQLVAEWLGNTRGLGQVALYASSGTLGPVIDRREPTGLPAPPPMLPDNARTESPEGRWLPPSMSERGELILRFAEPFRIDGRVAGFVLATLAPRTLSEIAEAISRDRFENRRDGVLLVGEGGRILASGMQTGPLAVGANLERADVLAASRLSAADFGREFGLSVEFAAANGEAMVGTVRTLPSHRWLIAVRRDAESVFEALARTRRSVGAAAGVFLAVALAVGAWLAARTTAPVAQLVELARAYGRREFSRRSPVRSGDELQTLGDAMTGMAGAIEAGEQELLRRATVEKDLSRYLPDKVARAIADGTRAITLGGERRNVTVLFADVASFTTFSESAAPEQVVAFLNELFTVLSEVVFRHDGTVDKFLGDCIMAVFGAPDPMADHAARALAAAEDMQRFVEASAADWKARFGIEPQLAIGVNTGEALVGNLGSEARMEYTSIGDVVNVASRLESVARPGQILVTEAVAHAVGDEFAFHALGAHPLRGKTRTVEILELVR